MEQAASLVTRYQVHLDTMHYTLLNVYMMCTSFLVSLLLIWLSLYLVTRYQVHLDTMHYTLLFVYMMCTSFLVSVLLIWLSLYQPKVLFRV